MTEKGNGKRRAMWNEMAVGWEISIWEKTHLVHPNFQLSTEILNACFPPSQVEKIAEPLSRNTCLLGAVTLVRHIAIL